MLHAKMFTALAIIAVCITTPSYSSVPDWTDHNDSDPGIAAPYAPGEKGGTEDINIGIGELRRGNNETDFAFERERASVVRTR